MQEIQDTNELHDKILDYVMQYSDDMSTEEVKAFRGVSKYLQDKLIDFESKVQKNFTSKTK